MGMKNEFRVAGDRFKVAIDSIVPDPDQPRKDFNETSIAELANSIALLGQLTPINGRLIEGGKFMLNAGERRWRAALYINANEHYGMKIEFLEAIPEPKGLTGSDRFIRQLASNVVHEDLGPIDLAKAMKRLATEFTMTPKEIAKQLGCSDQNVRNYLILLTLPEGIIGAVKAGQITVTAAIATARAHDDAVTEEIERKVERGEKVRQKDVDDMQEEPEPDIQKVLSFEAIQDQILKAGRMVFEETTQKGKEKWEGVQRGLRIAAGLEELLK